MSFVYAYRDENESIRDSVEYRRALEVAQGAESFLMTYYVDKDRNYIFFHLGEESERERPPGDYLLFVNGRAVQVKAYNEMGVLAGGGYKINYAIKAIKFIDELLDMEVLLAILREFFFLIESSRTDKPVAIEIELIG